MNRPPCDCERLRAEYEDRLEAQRHAIEVAWRSRDAAWGDFQRLNRWKSEAMQVLAAWEAVYDALGRPGLLGESKADSALIEVQRMRGTP